MTITPETKASVAGFIVVLALYILLSRLVEVFGGIIYEWLSLIALLLIGAWAADSLEKVFKT